MSEQMSFDAMLQGYVNMEYEELLEVAKGSLDILWPDCTRFDSENNGTCLLISIILSAIGADGELSVLERKFLRDLTKLTDEQIDNMIELYSGEMIEAVQLFLKELPVVKQGTLLSLLISILSCDERINLDENNFLLNLFQ